MVNKLWCIHSMEYFSITKRNSLLILATTSMTLTDIKQEKPGTKPGTIYTYICSVWYICSIWYIYSVWYICIYSVWLHLYEVPEQTILIYGDISQKHSAFLMSGVCVCWQGADEWLRRDTREYSRVFDMFYILTVVVVTWVYLFVKLIAFFTSNGCILFYLNNTTTTK